ncbi:hypothetical protein BC936DRAFT_147503 [Jimgerdemannia flammicorona]|uniref:Protein kinase domain-containing protein n=1 Tax=Jimgerdemannia flammicorona TaxID=994334 RepID=A0A433D569_9FUNG|nr:hypothetical protein BC936DRAFT_147503 [Jimgerdemannia flammicorona]
MDGFKACKNPSTPHNCTAHLTPATFVRFTASPSSDLMANIPTDSSPLSHADFTSFIEKPRKARFSASYDVPCLPKGSVELGDAIGQGAYGCIYRGTYNNMTVAIKHINMGHVDTKGVDKMVQNELKLLYRLRESNFVIPLIGYYRHTEFLVWIVMEYADNGDLRKFLLKGYLNGKWLAKLLLVVNVATHLSNLFLIPPQAHLCASIAKAVDGLHYYNVTHGDLKASNILIDRLLTPKPDSDWSPVDDVGKIPDDVPTVFRQLVHQCLASEPSHRPSLASVQKLLNNYLATTPVGSLQPSRVTLQPSFTDDVPNTADNQPFVSECVTPTINVRSTEFCFKTFERLNMSKGITRAWKLAQRPAFRINPDCPPLIFDTLDQRREETLVSETNWTQAFIEINMALAAVSVIAHIPLDNAVLYSPAPKDLLIYQNTTFAKAKMSLQRRNLLPNDDFKNAVENALSEANTLYQFKELMTLFDRFGFFWTKTLTLGGNQNLQSQNWSDSIDDPFSWAIVERDDAVPIWHMLDDGGLINRVEAVIDAALCEFRLPITRAYLIRNVKTQQYLSWRNVSYENKRVKIAIAALMDNYMFDETYKWRFVPALGTLNNPSPKHLCYNYGFGIRPCESDGKFLHANFEFKAPVLEDRPGRETWFIKPSNYILEDDETHQNNIDAAMRNNAFVSKSDQICLYTTADLIHPHINRAAPGYLASHWIPSKNIFAKKKSNEFLFLFRSLRSSSDTSNTADERNEERLGERPRKLDIAANRFTEVFIEREHHGKPRDNGVWRLA